MSRETVNERLLNANIEMVYEQTSEINYTHAALCQVGLPRSNRNKATIFERTSGTTSIQIEAGSLWDGKNWRQQTLPYGIKPRLTLFHISSYAIKNKTQIIPMGDNISQFLRELGFQTSGGKTGPLTRFKNQINALAACNMKMGYVTQKRGSIDTVTTVNGQPIAQFDAWLHADGAQKTLWPAEIMLSEAFYESLLRYAVPLDKRAISALRESSLALDIYTWLTHRLCRLKTRTRLPWACLKDQFGQEYNSPKDFKRAFMIALLQTKEVYPAAKIEKVNGGLVIKPSPPAVKKTRVIV